MNAKNVLSSVVPYTALEADSWAIGNLWYSHFGECGGIRLTDVVDINLHKFNLNKDAGEGECFVYLEVGDIHGELGIVVNPGLTPSNELTDKAKNLARAGDVLFSLVRPQNRNIAIIPKSICIGKYIVSSSFAVLTPKKISAELLFFILRSDSMTELFANKATGTTIPQLGLKVLQDVIIPIGSLPISEAAERKASGLYYEWVQRAQSSESFEAIASRLIEKEIISTVMEASTAENNALIMPYEILKDRWDALYYFTVKAEPKILWKCPEVQLSELVSFPRMAVLSKEDQADEGTPFVRVRDIDSDALWITEHSFSKIQPINEAYLQEKDVVMVKTGTLSGNAALVSAHLVGGQLNQHSVALRVKNQLLIPEFLAVFLKSVWAKAQLKKMTSGSNQPFIQLAELGSLSIPIPTIEVQEGIVQACLREYEANSLDEIANSVSYLLKEIVQGG